MMVGEEFSVPERKMGFNSAESTGAPLLIQAAELHYTSVSNKMIFVLKTVCDC